jgi:polyhydroxybutyrate depolymerase
VGVVLASAIWLLSFNAQAQSAQKITLSHDGIDRTVHVYLPEKRPDKLALIVALHGYGSSAENIMAYSGLNALAERHGYIVAYPQGTLDEEQNTFFNVGYEFHAESNIDDIGFIRKIVSHLVSLHPINPSQIFATGMSNGGDMSYLLGCQAADLFNVIAPVAGTMMVSNADDCRPSEPVSVLAISGTSDNVTWFSGDLENAGGWGAYLGVDVVVDGWAGRLPGSPNERSKTIEYANDNPVHVRTYGSDDGIEQVVLYRVEQGGHDWPGARFKWWDIGRFFALYAMGFGEHQGLDASSEIVGFFNRFRGTQRS